MNYQIKFLLISLAVTVTTCQSLITRAIYKGPCQFASTVYAQVTHFWHQIHSSSWYSRRILHNTRIRQQLYPHFPPPLSTYHLLLPLQEIATSREDETDGFNAFVPLFIVDMVGLRLQVKWFLFHCFPTVQNLLTSNTHPLSSFSSSCLLDACSNQCHQTP